MNLLIDSTSLNHEFKRLINKYKNFSGAVAWASINSSVYDYLIINKSKIEKFVVGLHFYQTHPEFIKEFISDKRVHFIEKTSGIFHPKIYLFYDDEKVWELLVGSSNFTKAAFTTNTEVNVLISSKDFNASTIFEKAYKVIETSWKEGVIFRKNELNNYIKIWQTQQIKINSLSGKYGSQRKKNVKETPIFDVPILTMNWKQFISRIKSNEVFDDRIINRLTALRIAREIFESKSNFKKMTPDERKYIAGIPNNLNDDASWLWGTFGSMQGAGIFKNKIIQNDDNISTALDKIPLKGNITKTNYDEYIKYFQLAFKGTRLESANNIATATRLLTLKRPDTFICFASKNRKKMCLDFGINQSKINFESYWQEIIMRIYDSYWWNNTKPTNKQEQEISLGKVAFLDSLYYVE